MAKTRKSTTKRKATRAKTPAKPSCKVTPRATAAGHRLATEAHSQSGTYLATTAKKEKKARKDRGCLNGPPGTFKLTAKQKRNLSPAMQKGILAYQRKLGKKVIK
jgi:hypothetical protein